MAAGLALQCEILVDELAVAGRAKTWKVAAMYDRHVEAAHALERRQIVADLGMIGVVDQRPVIDDVARQEHAGLALEERDPARRVARRVDDLEGAVAEIDDVAVLQDAAGGRGATR